MYNVHIACLRQVAAASIDILTFSVCFILLLVVPGIMCKYAGFEVSGIVALEILVR